MNKHRTSTIAAATRAFSDARLDLMAKLRQAFGLHQQGRLGDAELLYREVLAGPRSSDALHFLGVLEHNAAA